MSEFKKGMEKQRTRNITIWVGRIYHKKLRKIAYEKGVSLTYVLNNILKDYFGRSKKRND